MSAKKVSARAARIANRLAVLALRHPAPTLFLTGARLVCSLESSPCLRTRRYRRMPSVQESDLCPSWRFFHPSNKQNVAFGRWPEKKMLIYDERSWNVYENKETIDIITDKSSDIYGNLTGEFAEFSGFRRTFCRNLRLRCGIWWAGPERAQRCDSKTD